MLRFKDWDPRRAGAAEINPYGGQEKKRGNLFPNLDPVGEKFIFSRVRQ